MAADPSPTTWSDRFEQGLHPAIERFNASIGFDIALLQEDLDGSIAHARMLGRCGVITPEEAERLIEECGLTGSNPMGIPGVKSTFQDHDADEGLEKSLHTPFLGSAARSNYLSADRVDLQFAGKEVCRSMSEPTKLSWKALKRIGRYLCGRPRLVYVYRRLCEDEKVHLRRCCDAGPALHQTLVLHTAQRLTQQW